MLWRPTSTTRVIAKQAQHAGTVRNKKHSNNPKGDWFFGQGFGQVNYATVFWAGICSLKFLWRGSCRLGSPSEPPTVLLWKVALGNSWPCGVDFWPTTRWGTVSLEICRLWGQLFFWWGNADCIHSLLSPLLLVRQCFHVLQPKWSTKVQTQANNDVRDARCDQASDCFLRVGGGGVVGQRLTAPHVLYTRVYMYVYRYL